MEVGAGLAVAVVLRLGPARYAVPTAFVDEVLPIPGVTRVPGVPPWLAGVANWRGRVLAVLDLRPLLGVPLGLMPPSGRLVVVSADGVAVGLMVHDVPGVLDDEMPEIQTVPATLGAQAAGVLAGQVVCDGLPVGVLDVPAVLALRQQLDRRRGA